MAKWQMNDHSFGKDFNLDKICRNSILCFDRMAIWVWNPVILYFSILSEGFCLPGGEYSRELKNLRFSPPFDILVQEP
jgi:hypothetical protein